MNNRYQNFITKQITTHRNLIAIVRKHTTTTYLRPIPSHQIAVFKHIKQFAQSVNLPLIIDSGCGTGQSTKKLAEIFPDHGVIGIDKSIARLARAAPSSLTNYILVRGNLIDLFRLLAAENLPISRHYLFFPNPWPKATHITRRFHAHPVFSTMISIAQYFELRTNWHIYAQECKLALETINQRPTLTLKSDTDFMTLFEKKYMDALCPIYIVTNTRTLL
jgi:tRNA (guanine-N7-)-methyltransferase